MSNTEFSDKYTAVYRCGDDINNLIIRISFKEKTSDESESKVFKWQQKVYSKFEREYYKNEANCVTDLEKKYHQDVVKLRENDDLLFSYVNHGNFTPDLQLYEGRHKIRPTVLEKDHSNDGCDVKHEYDLHTSLLDSIKYPIHIKEYETMYIIADLGEYVDDTWIQAEQVLCTLKYDKKNNVLIIHPDFNKSKPYLLQIEDDVTKNYVYQIENVSDFITDNKLTPKRHKIETEALEQAFVQPPKTRLDVFLSVEICTGQNFEYDNIYVQYFIDLPENWTCKDHRSLSGTTHTSCVNKQDKPVNFGFTFDTILHYDLEEHEEVLKAPCIYFEVISKDTWSRYRTEGVTYKIIPICSPGIHNFDLSCVRLFSNELKRYFIGDCSSYNDVTWFGLPRWHEGSTINKFGVNTISTGQIQIRMSLVHQSQALIEKGGGDITTDRDRFLLERLNAFRLVKSVHEVIEAFKKAKKRMVEARSQV